MPQDRFRAPGVGVGQLEGEKGEAENRSGSVKRDLIDAEFFKKGVAFAGAEVFTAARALHRRKEKRSRSPVAAARRRCSAHFTSTRRPRRGVWIVRRENVIHYICACGRPLEIAENLPTQITFKRCAGCKGTMEEKAHQAGMIKVYDSTLGRDIWAKPGRLKGFGGRKRT